MFATSRRLSRTNMDAYWDAEWDIKPEAGSGIFYGRDRG